MKRAGYWEVGPIYIDDDNPSSNWTFTEATYGWISGNGTWGDPYIIENITIDGNGGPSIDIKNSNVPFIIRNCTFINYTLGVYAIRLLNVNNSLLFKNNLSDIYAGLWLEDSNNNTISKNNFTTNPQLINHGHLITLKNSNYNNISTNFLNNTGNKGISLFTNNEYNIISNNVINNTGGILSSSNSNNNNITQNLLKSGGIQLVNADKVNILNNTLDDGALTIYGGITNSIIKGNFITNRGIILDDLSFDTSNLIDTTNLVNNKPFYYYNNKNNLGSNNFTNAGQIILDRCNNSKVSNLNLSYASRGLTLFYSNNITISKNNISNNQDKGIYLRTSSYNNISKNQIHGNYRGISVLYSDYNLISKNNISKSTDIALFIFGGSEYNTIFSNNITYTDDDGIYLMDRSSNNIIL